MAEPLDGYPCVRLWRDLMLLNCSQGFKRDIIATVACDGEEGLKLWREILEGWGFMKNGKWKSKNRFAIGQQLQAYEMELEKRRER